jgi:hypothetical protein
MADSIPSVREPLVWAHWKTDSSVIETWVNPKFQIIKDSAKDEYEVYWNVIHKVVQSCPSLEEAQGFCQRLRDVIDGRDVAREIVDALDAKATRMVSDANILRWAKGKPEAAGIREAVELITERWLMEKPPTRGPKLRTRVRFSSPAPSLISLQRLTTSMQTSMLAFATVRHCFLLFATSYCRKPSINASWPRRQGAVVAPNCLKPPVTLSDFHGGRRHLTKPAFHFPSYDPGVPPSPLTTDRIPKVIVEVTVPAEIPPVANVEFGSIDCSSSN